MKLKSITTSWTLTYFWVLLSTILAILSTFSFVQVDWLVKRETLIVTHYQVPTVNRSSAVLQVGTRTTSSHIQRNRTAQFKIIHPHIAPSWPDFPVVDYHTEELRRRWNWTVNKIVKKTVTVFSIGVVGVCTNYPASSQECSLHEDKFGPIYVLWVVLTLVGGLGCLTLSASAVMSMLAVALPTSKLRYQVARTIGQAQAVSVVLLFLSLLGFPLGFASDAVKLHCGREASPYFNMGGCEVGWAYALLIVCSSLSLYCPVLVHFTIVVKPQCLPKYL